MPLIKSKSKHAFEHNIGAEMEAGKPNDQALAIAYAIKKRSKKMAAGGVVRKEMDLSHEDESHEHLPEPTEPKRHVMASEENMPEHMGKGIPHIGSVMKSNPVLHASEEGPAMSLMEKIKQKHMMKMAQGGQIPDDLAYLDENDSYPDPDLKEFDMLDPHKPEGMADGGMVALGKSLKKAFNTPEEAPHEESMQEKYDKIRKQNTANMGQAEGGMIDPKEEHKKKIRKMLASHGE